MSRITIIVLTIFCISCRREKADPPAQPDFRDSFIGIYSGYATFMIIQDTSYVWTGDPDTLEVGKSGTNDLLIDGRGVVFRQSDSSFDGPPGREMVSGKFGKGTIKYNNHHTMDPHSYYFTGKKVH